MASGSKLQPRASSRQAASVAILSRIGLGSTERITGLQYIHVVPALYRVAVGIWASFLRRGSMDVATRDEAAVTQDHSDHLAFYDSARYRLTLSLVLGPFLVLFLLVFLPFGVSNYDPDHEFTLSFLGDMATFGLAVTGASLFNEFALRPLVFRRATMGRVIAWSAWSCLLLSQVVFLVYNALGGWHDFRWSSAIGFLGNCTAVFIFPLAGTFFYFRYHDLRRRLSRTIRQLTAIPAAGRMLTFEGQGSADRLTIRSQDFLFARAQDNYVELHHLRDQRPEQTLIRSTLSAIAEQVPGSCAVRCHRSYLVNLEAVRAVRGPRNALRLELRGVDTPIPVSRGFAAELEAALDNVR